jgi:ChrB-like protein
MTRQPANGPGNWVLLSYRMPREPSTPRITIWRKLKRLGVAQLGDGLVALPGDARTREHLDWIAEEIVESGGTATVWLAQPATLTQERELAAGMAAARSEEYRAVIDHAATAASGSEPDRVRTIRRLRDELRRIHRRDYFPPVERDTARLAVETLARSAAKADSPETTP